MASGKDEKIKFTATESRIIKALSDGKPHPRMELLACLLDEYAELGTLQAHLSNIRRKLKPIGQDIVCEIGNKTIHYRQVRLLVFKKP